MTAGRAPRNDSLLLRATKAGDSEAFGELYERHCGVVLAFLARRVPNAEIAADLMAETFAAALLATHDGRAPTEMDATPWLITIARNKLIDSIRRGRSEADARRRLEMSPVVLDDYSLARVEELIDASTAALDSLKGLPATQRRVVRERVLEERSYREIAARLTCSEMVIRKQVSRALQSLRTSLGGNRA